MHLCVCYRKAGLPWWSRDLIPGPLKTQVFVMLRSPKQQVTPFALEPRRKEPHILKWPLGYLQQPTADTPGH